MSIATARSCHNLPIAELALSLDNVVLLPGDRADRCAGDPNFMFSMFPRFNVAEPTTIVVVRFAVLPSKSQIKLQTGTIGTTRNTIDKQKYRPLLCGLTARSYRFRANTAHCSAIVSSKAHCFSGRLFSNSNTHNPRAGPVPPPTPQCSESRT